ncbi:hypothetical protein C8R26_11768 [Nitrosomonas oligotropha]|uniref:Uncharacterized protein n=1 Tax=Nitrosomonas oligotropha TaxID=42354 RepID=A0A2T5HY15_9PROT|nr:hypothetical protein [Nitrosomonas oligotropha]PTQ76475.1 hypothetical protein C8R26_11768 [Nitrosomonas oligotropha]
MDICSEWQWLIPSIVVVVGWCFVHITSKNRDIEAARRNLRAKYLIDAYRAISFTIQRKDLTIDEMSQLERACDEIHLFGNEEQIKNVHDIMANYFKDSLECRANKQIKLLDSIRSELRQLFKEDPKSLEKFTVLRLDRPAAK